MRIGFDATPIKTRKSGIGYYAENLVRNLAEVEEIDEILVFSNRAPVFDGPPPARGRWCSQSALRSRALWLQLRLPGLIGSRKPDLTHYVNFNAPVLYPHPFVVTFHDCVLYRHPEFYTWKKRFLTRSVMPTVARRALGIITVSCAAKQEIVELLGVSEDKIFVVPNAAGEVFRPVSDASRLQAVLTHHEVEPPYLLFVGTLEPRKNLSRLLEAFDLLKSETTLPHKLVVVGARGWKFAPIFETIDRLRHRSSVRILDYVDLADLPALYSASDLFVFPSLYEGFGIPILEAMQCGTPVLCSNIPAHREVAGEAAEICEPLSVRSIAEGMKKLLQEPAVACELKRLGLERVQAFSWKRSAQETAEVYQQVLSRLRAA